MFAGVREWYVTLIFPVARQNDKHTCHGQSSSLWFWLAIMIGLPLTAQGAPAGSFVQNDWRGGASLSSSAAHPGDQTGWTLYQSKDFNLSVEADGTLAPGLQKDSVHQTTTEDFTPDPNNTLTVTSDADFSANAQLTQTEVTLGRLRLAVASATPAWTANSAWDLVDIGANAAPALADLDGDGDLDILVGNALGLVDAYENIGSLETGPRWLFNSGWGLPAIAPNARPAVADLDGDGDDDMLVGDSTGAVHAYQNVGNAETPAWLPEPAWQLPDVLAANAAPALADLDGDGDADLLVGDGEGEVIAYENNLDGPTPQWLARSDWDVRDESDTRVDVGAFAAPALVDFDEDGDYDLVIGELTGFVRAYVNTGTTGSPQWSATPALDLGDLGDYTMPVFGHLDAEPGIDLIVGQLQGQSLGFANSGIEYHPSGEYISGVFDVGEHDDFTILNYTATVPDATTLKVEMRAGDTPDLSAIAWEDGRDNTGLADGGLISTLGDGAYVQFRLSYATTDTSVTPSVDDLRAQFRRYPFANGTAVQTGQVRLAIVSQALEWTANSTWFSTDVGGYAKPALADLDNDGDLDLMLGESGGVVFGFINTGSRSAPQWEAEPSWNTPDLGTRVAPALADLDGDRDYDMVIGNSSGILLAYENTGDVNTPVWTARAQWNPPDTGIEAVPAVADVDHDGDIDLMVGAGDGVVYGYENSGTATRPVWVANSVWNSPSIGSFAAPALADLDADGRVDLMVGDSTGFAQGFRNTGTVATPVWTANGPWNSPDIGSFAGLALADVNADWTVDLLIGDVNGLLFPQENTGVSAFDTIGVAGAGREYSSAILALGTRLDLDLELAFSVNQPGNTTFRLDVRSGPSAFPGSGWSTWRTGIANGVQVSVPDDHHYVQYRAQLNSPNNSLTPSLADVTVSYSRYALNETLLSSPYDTTDTGNLLDSLAWIETLPEGADVQLQLRTAPDNSGTTWGPFVGPDGTTDSYWNSTNTFDGGCQMDARITCDKIPSVLRDGVDDRWLQYEITLVSAGDVQPIVSEVAVDYASATAAGSGGAGVSVSSLAGTTSEAGGTATFSVVLDAAPTDVVTLNLASSDPGEGVVSVASLTFTPTNWASPQQVTVTGVDDDQDDGDASYAVLLSALISRDANYDDLNPPDVAITNTDNDASGVTVSPASGLVTEENGTVDHFTVVLTSQPAADVVLGVSGGDSSEGRVAPADLTFTPADWNSPQRVTVTGVDDDVVDGAVAYNVAIAAAVSDDPRYAGIDAADVAVQNQDNDVAGVVVLPSSDLLTNESGGIASFDIALSSRPNNNVTFNLIAGNDQEGIVTPTAMTFTPDNWNISQPGHVSGVADGVVDGDVSYSVELTPFVSADPAFNGADPDDLTVVNIDIDEAKVTVTPTTGLVTTEAGGTAEFFVSLGAPPASGRAVTLQFASSDVSEVVTVPESVTFDSTAGAEHAAKIQIIGLADRTFDGDQAVTIEVILTSTDTAYDGIDPPDVSVINLDGERGIETALHNDIAGSLFGQGVAVVDVNCDSLPDLVIGTEGQTFDEVAVYHGSVTGYADRPDWIGRDTVSGTDFGSRVFAVGDITGDGCDEMLVAAPLTAASAGAVYLFAGSADGLPDADGDGIGLPSDALWQVVGDQPAALFGESAVGGDFNGDGLVDLAVSAPAYDAGQSDEGAVFVFFNSASGLINEAAWRFESDTAAALTGVNEGLAVANVNGDGFDDLLIGAHLATSGEIGEGRVFAFYGAGSGLADADADDIARASDADWIAESDAPNAFFGYAIANAGDLNNDGADDILVGAHHLTDQLSRQGAAFLFPGSIGSGLPDADDNGIAKLSDAAWQAFGGDSEAYFGAALGPAGDFDGDGLLDIIVGAYNFDTGAGEGGNAVVFIGTGDAMLLSTSPRWRETGRSSGDHFGRRVGLIGDIDNDGASEVFVSAPNFQRSDDGRNDGAVFIYLSRARPAGITVTPTTALTTSESQEISDSFTVVLDVPPSGQVTVPIASDNPAEGTVSPNQLIFDATNWAIAQTVTVTGVNDGAFDGDVSYLVSVEPVISADPDYDGLDPDDVAVTNLDNEVPADVSIEVDDDVAEGEEQSFFTVRRTGEVEAALDVIYIVGGTATMGDDFSALNGVLEIPAGSDSAQLAINAIDDPRVEPDETITITLVPTAQYSVVTEGTPEMILFDNDEAGISVFPVSGLVTNEIGGADSFGVSLTSQPERNVSMAWFTANSAEGIIDGATEDEPLILTFTSNNWNQTQFVTVIGVQDTLIDGDMQFLVEPGPAQSTDPSYNGLVASSVSVTNRDEETVPLVSVVASTPEVMEGDSGQAVFTLSRSGDLRADMAVFYELTGTAEALEDYEASLSSSTIPAGRSSVDVPIVPLQDDDAELAETVVMEVLRADDYLVNNPATATVVIIDDETFDSLPIVNLSLDQRIGEGGTVEVVVALTRSGPTIDRDIVIPYTISGTATFPDDHDAEDGNVTIGPNANSATITIHVAEDDIADSDETIVVTLGFAQNAQHGDRTTHTITITEFNAPPQVTLVAKQALAEFRAPEATRLVVANNFIVTVTAEVTDPNPDDAHTFDWSLTDNALVDLDDDGLAETFEFNPLLLEEDFYRIGVTVTDSAEPALSSTTDLLLNIVSTPPTLNLSANTDGDELDDGAESYNDFDLDGIPDFLDYSGFGRNEMPGFVGSGETFILRTEPGLSLKLGDVAFVAGSDGAFLTTENIEDFGDGEGGPGVADADDPQVSATDITYFDFKITGLPEAGQSARVVIPLFGAIPNAPGYRKYDPDTGWFDFVENANNAIASAPGEPGICPPPGDERYQPGLTTGDFCVELTIEDGGPNDADGWVNHAVADPGGVVTFADTGNPGDGTTRSSDGKGGGAFGLPSVLALASFFVLSALLRRRIAMVSGKTRGRAQFDA